MQMPTSEALWPCMCQHTGSPLPKAHPSLGLAHTPPTSLGPPSVHPAPAAGSVYPSLRVQLKPSADGHHLVLRAANTPHGPPATPRLWDQCCLHIKVTCWALLALLQSYLVLLTDPGLRAALPMTKNILISALLCSKCPYPQSSLTSPAQGSSWSSQEALLAAPHQPLLHCLHPTWAEPQS